MKKVKLHDKQFRLFIESGIITSKIKDLAEVINHDFANKKPIFLCVLNGSFLFASELIKRFNYDCEVSFVKLASYEGVQTTGKIKNLIGLNDEIKNRNVIVVEDIVDTGNTIYILDEPTTGLHFEDIRVLMDVLNKLVDKGNTVIIIEHNLDVIKTVDYIIDIGPEGGKGGGEILVKGTPEVVVKNKSSHTAKFLKKELH